MDEDSLPDALRAAPANDARRPGSAASSLATGVVSRPRERPAWAVAGLERREARIGGYAMSYLYGGDGQPVLLLHGIGAGNFIWRKTFPALLPHYAVYAPDMLGCGHSDKPAIAYTVQALSTHVREFLASLGLQRVRLVAHSMGGVVALALCAQYPDLVERLALVSTGGFGREVSWLLRVGTLPGAAALAATLADSRLWLHNVGVRLERAIARRWHVVDDDDVPTLLDRWREPDQRLAFARTARGVANVCGQTFSAQRMSSALAHIPTLIVWGGSDPVMPLAHGRRAAALLANAQLHIFPECYHDPQLEAPQAFNATLLAFLGGAPLT